MAHFHCNRIVKLKIPNGWNLPKMTPKNAKKMFFTKKCIKNICFWIKHFCLTIQWLKRFIFIAMTCRFFKKWNIHNIATTIFPWLWAYVGLDKIIRAKIEQCHLTNVMLSMLSFNSLIWYVFIQFLYWSLPVPVEVLLLPIHHLPGMLNSFDRLCASTQWSIPIEKTSTYRWK